MEFLKRQSHVCQQDKLWLCGSTDQREEVEVLHVRNDQELNQDSVRTTGGKEIDSKDSGCKEQAWVTEQIQVREDLLVFTADYWMLWKGHKIYRNSFQCSIH